MKLALTLLCSVLLMFAALNSARAEMLTFKQAVHIALKDNPAMKSSGWALKAQEQDVYGAKGNLYPKIWAEEKLMRTNNPTYSFMAKLNQENFTQNDFLIDSLNNPADTTDFQASINFEQPLFAPGVYAGIGMAGKELEAKKAEHKIEKEGVALNVIKAANMIRTAREYVNMARKGMEEATEHKRLAVLRYDAGLTLYSDVLRAEVAVKKAEAAAVRSESDLEVAKRTLGLVLGRTEPVDITEDRPLFPLNDLSVYLDASRSREDLRAMKLRRESSKQAVKKERSVFIPEAGIAGSYFLNDESSPFSPDAENYMLVGFVRWNLFDNSAFHKIKKAKAMAYQAEENLSGMEKNINFLVNKAYARVKEKMQNLSLAAASLNEAEEGLRLVSLRYENSLTPMVDLLDMQATLDGVRAELVSAENEYHNALADLYYQSGILLRTIDQN